MSDRPSPSVALVGCGRLGSAILEGWLLTGAVDPARLVILTPSMKHAAETARGHGAVINPPAAVLADVDIVVLAVKPGAWRKAVEPWRAQVGADAVVVSVMAGVSLHETAEVFAASVARVMPTTGVAQGRGVASAWARDERAWAAARALFNPIADLVELSGEDHMDAATAVAGCGPAYVLALARSMARAGRAQGLTAQDADRLARGALRSAAAVLDGEGSLDEMIGRIASPGGVTEAGLKVLAQDDALDRLAARTIQAAVDKAGGA